jgi:Domain of unknown function (DUF3291)
MNPEKYHLAQVNIGRALAPVDDPIMAEFMALLDEINSLADRSPGFVWRLQTEEGNASAFRPYEDDRILINLSVWKSLEELKTFVYKSAHTPVMQRRRQWFEKFDGVYMALWWVEAGHIPDIAEAKDRLEYLARHGESEMAFTFKHSFPPPGESSDKWIVTPFDPCPAA